MSARFAEIIRLPLFGLVALIAGGLSLTVAAGQTILGEPVYASLHEAAQQARIDLVNVFRQSEDVPPVVDEAIAIGAPAIWLQLGIRHDEAAARARAAGLAVVQDKCLKVEWARRSVRPGDTP